MAGSLFCIRIVLYTTFPHGHLTSLSILYRPQYGQHATSDPCANFAAAPLASRNTLNSQHLEVPNGIIGN